MNLIWFTNIENIYLITSLILSIGLLIAALEDIVTFDVFQSTGLLSWRVSKMLTSWTCRGFVAKYLDWFLNDKSFKYSIYLRILGSLLLLILSLMKIISPFLLGALFFLKLLIFLRSPYSLDGAYQMYMMVLLALAIGSFFGIPSKASIISLFFIGAQLTCSYVISGITKLGSPIWRKSYAMNAVFSTRTYGHPFVYNLISKNQLFAYLSSWSVMLFETMFVVAPFSSPEVALLLLSIGFTFHLANAIFMGLNDFLFSFLAAYPSFIFFNLMINR